MPPKGIAILGAGIFAKEAHLPALKTLGSSAPPLLAVYSRSEKSATELASEAKALLSLSSPPDIYFDVPNSANSQSLDALFSREDIGSVILALPITIQPAIIRQALAAGKHVLSEKPLAPTVKEGRELIEEYNAKYKSKSLIWRVAENFECEPAHLKAKELIAEGAIGDISWFTVRVVNYVDKDSKWYKTPWRTIPDYQGGFLLDGGVHTAAAVRTILPKTFATISAQAELHQSYLPPHDTITAVTSKPQGVIELTWGAPGPGLGAARGNGLTFVGTTGYLVVANGPGGIRVTVTKVDKSGKESTEVYEEKSVGVVEEQKSFFKALEGHDDGKGSVEGGLWDVAFIQAGLTSNGKAIDMDELVKSG